MAGLRRGRRTGANRSPAEAHRAPGPPPPLRQRDRVAVHPAGSPWLAEARLQSLLDQARPDQPPAATAEAPTAGDWVVEWPLRAAKSGQEAVADGYRRWQEGAPKRKALGRRVIDLASEAAESVHGLTDIILGHRPARS